MGPEAAKDFVEFLAAKGMCMRNGQIVPVEDPRVLRRVLQKMYEIVLMYVGSDAIGSIQELIDQARRELESEAGK